MCNQVIDDVSDCMDSWAEVNNALSVPLNMNEYISQSRRRSRGRSRSRGVPTQQENQRA